jgi:RNA polymerase sigma-70 factor, ECF subfamily
MWYAQAPEARALRGVLQTTVNWSTRSDERSAGALAHDSAALARLYDDHAGLVYGLAVAILGNPTEAEDLTQEIFLSLCEDSGYDPKRGSVPAFLTTLTRSRAIDRLRRRSRHTRLLRSAWEAEPQGARPPNPLDHLSLRQCADRVRAALATLPDTERRALEMAYYRGLTQAEIADDLGAALGTVKSWSRRGLLAMRKALADMVE